MKKITMLMVASVAVMALAATSFGQAAGPKGGAAGQGKAGQRQGGPGGPRAGGGMRGKMMEEVMAKLNLSAAQKMKWDAVTEEQKAEMQKMRGADPAKMDRKAMMAKFKGFQDKRMAILTPEQKKKFDALVKEAREKFEKEHPGGFGGPGGGRGPGGPPGGGAAAGGKGGKKGGGL